MVVCKTWAGFIGLGSGLGSNLTFDLNSQVIDQEMSDINNTLLCAQGTDLFVHISLLALN